MSDVLIVALGGTAGLRASDDALAGSLRRAGATVAMARVGTAREVRTFALTDLAWAVPARRAAQAALARERPRALVYATTSVSPSRRAERHAASTRSRPFFSGFAP